MAVWFTDRRGGISEPPYAQLQSRAARRRRSRRGGRKPAPAWIPVIGERPVVWMDQVHGRTVTVVDRPVQDSRPGDGRPGHDAARSGPRGAGGRLRAGDAARCRSATVRRRAEQVIAAAHAGRRGLQLGVVEAVVSRMSLLGVQPKAIVAQLGPGGVRQVL